jgi:DNA-binding NtrC family response regulator
MMAPYLGFDGRMYCGVPRFRIDPSSVGFNRTAIHAERKVILRVLGHTNWNRKKAEKLLNISYKAILNKIKEYGLTR